MEYKELAGLSQTELKEKQVALQKELAMLRFDKVSGKVLDTAAPNKKRRELAKVLTRMSELKRNAQNG